MIVCKYCLAAIESHEGHQIRKQLSHFELGEISDENGEIKCDWCEETFDEFDCPTMYEI